jgi:uridine kinase
MKLQGREELQGRFSKSQPPPAAAAPLQVGLAGPSGSGKTAFSEKIKSFIPGCALLSMDNYNDGSKVIDGNFDGEWNVWSAV